MRFSRNCQAITACVAVATAMAATGFASLPQQSQRASRVASIERMPIAAIEDGFASMGTLADRHALTREPRQASCDNFEFSFLSSTCSKSHTKHVRRRHSVATFVIGRRDASRDIQPNDGEAGGKIE